MYIALILIILVITTISYTRSKFKPTLQKNIKFILFSITFSLIIGWLCGPIETRHFEFPWWTRSILIVLPTYSLLLLGYFKYWSKRNPPESEGG